MSKKLIYFFSMLLLVFIGCSTNTEEKKSNQNNIKKPSELKYSPAILNVDFGKAKESVKPQLNNGGSSVTFSLISTIPGISIDSKTGIIRVSTSTKEGNYKLSVSVKNSTGKTDFSDVLTVIVRKTALVPQSIKYSPDKVNVELSKSFTSSIPSIDNGGSAITEIKFKNNNSPTSGITVNSKNGVISVSANVAKGTYVISLTVTNSVGSKSFDNVLTITVVEAVSVITFNSDIKAIFQNNCSPCHVSGGSQKNYSVYSIAKSDINEIIRRIKLSQGSQGFMPLNGSSLSASVISKIEKWKTDGLKEN